MQTDPHKQEAEKHLLKRLKQMGILLICIGILFFIYGFMVSDQSENPWAMSDAGLLPGSITETIENIEDSELSAHEVLNFFFIGLIFTFVGLFCAFISWKREQHSHFSSDK